VSEAWRGSERDVDWAKALILSPANILGVLFWHFDRLAQASYLAWYRIGLRRVPS
jgi:hypothetical protein